MRSIFFLLLAVWLLCCGSPPVQADEEPPGKPEPTPKPVLTQVEEAALATEVLQVFEVYCARCHQGPGSSSGYEFDVRDLQNLLKEKVVVAGKLDGEDGIWAALSAGTMPPQKEKLRPSDREMVLVQRWIQAGAPVIPPPQGRPFITEAEVFEAAEAYLRKPERWNPDVNRDEFDPGYVRFFTLHNLWNDPQRSPESLNLSRAGLSKAINSMSWEARLALPLAVDERQTLYAIDLRDYGWHSSPQHEVDLWEDVLATHYPYGLRYTDDDIQPTQELLQERTGSRFPIMRADWFAGSATRPKMYYDMLRMPTEAGPLEEYLGVDIRTNFLNPRTERIARSGVMLSGVSAQNRLVERNVMKYPGGYWKSYDFKPDSDLANLPRYPLGPKNLFPDPAKLPYPDQAFVHDGGEVIFNLPNGLFGYFLLDGEDKRIDAGPVDVVSDDQETSGTPIIENALSCMACHAKGYRKIDDDIRVTTPYKGELLGFIERLYPPRARLQALMDQDQQLYTQAVRAVTAPYLTGKPEDGRSLEPEKLWQYGEPVSHLSDIYLNDRIGLDEVARELGEPDLKHLSQFRGDFEKVGLGGMFHPETSLHLTRQQWESGPSISLMQELTSRIYHDRHPLK